VLIVVVDLGVSEPARAPPGWDHEIVLWGNPTFAQGFTSVLNIAFACVGNQLCHCNGRDARSSKDYMLSIYILQVFAISMYSIVGVVIYRLA
jgi:hypothetical protein